MRFFIVSVTMLFAALAPPRSLEASNPVVKEETFLFSISPGGEGNTRKIAAARAFVWSRWSTGGRGRLHAVYYSNEGGKTIEDLQICAKDKRREILVTRVTIPAYFPSLPAQKTISSKFVATSVKRLGRKGTLPNIVTLPREFYTIQLFDHTGRYITEL